MTSLARFAAEGATVYLRTLGCRLNEAEIEQWARGFGAYGVALSDCAEQADVIVLNTCAVTAIAERKSRHLLRSLRRANPAARLVVSGCQASLQGEQAMLTLGADVVVPNARKDNLVIEAMRGCDRSLPLVREPSSLLQRGRQRAFIKIQDGCRWRCAFCVVTLARGEERSRAPAEILADVVAERASGVQEVTLTGVHVGGYGRDLGTNLAALIRTILTKTDLPRLRMASLEPWDLSQELLELFRDPRLQPHVHLPLQSGSDTLLKRMGRRGLTADFAALVGRARAVVPDLNITTDVIVGFPGETEARWRHTLDFVAAMAFGHVHVFPFSPRPGTKAANLPEVVAAKVKRERVEELVALAGVLQRKAMAGHVGRVEPVLWEGQIRDVNVGQTLQGYTPHYLRVQCQVPALGKTASEGWRVRPGGISTTQLLAVDTDASVLIGAPVGLVS